MIRIAIAGSGGLAQIFAHFINETVHQFVILSRQARPDLEALGYQVTAVDYDSQDDLRYHLRGVDLVISTVSGASQINLIDAAAHSRVLRFVPAEFEGPLGHRPTNDPLDRGRAASLDRLRHWSHHRNHPMRSTVFSCGVFYERFARGGLASLALGASTGIQYQGNYLMDVDASTAEIVEYHAGGQPIYLCLTSVHDVARFLVAALELNPQTWPGEFRMRGDRKTVSEIVQYAEIVKGGGLFSTTIIEPGDLAAHVQYATYCEDSITPETSHEVIADSPFVQRAKVYRMQELIATEQRRYDFTHANLNPLVTVQPTPFWDWLNVHYAQP